jgi:hypothetical protein
MDINGYICGYEIQTPRRGIFEAMGHVKIILEYHKKVNSQRELLKRSYFN